MEVVISVYKEKDYLEMLDVTMELWNLKMTPYTKKSIDINTSIIDDTGSIPKKINEGILIAKVNQSIAGVAHLDYKGKKTSEPESLSVIKLIKKYGLFRLLRVQKMGKFFEHEVNEDELHIHGIVVASKFRSMGIGSKLFDEIESIAKNKGLKKITLEVLDSNKLAYKLYKKLGFIDIRASEFTKKQKKYFKSNTHIYMIKELDIK
ncbi:GNAT family N-acetyltransferase [Mariniplasma anaerobium]|nr:GNAT family N-acetyltransferase [Mariniplasma anaerobium]